MSNCKEIENMASKPPDRNQESPPNTLTYSQTIGSSYDRLKGIAKEELGGKGFSLCKMAQLGLPVPPGFILKTNAWREFQAAGNVFPSRIADEITVQLKTLEAKTDCHLGNTRKPLFISVRSGAPTSMPGVMSTILNVGINDQTINILAQDIGESSAWEAYYELVSSFGSEIFGIDNNRFRVLSNKYLGNLAKLNEVPPPQLQAMIKEAKKIIEEKNFRFPEDTEEQLRLAIKAVFKSWAKPNAQQYRQLHGISEGIGTAVVVQQMVWGNSQKEGSGSGVMLTRNIKNFDPEPMIAFVEKAQGTVVVGESVHRQLNINELMVPQNVKKQLYEIAQQLEEYFHYPQEFEFTYDGKHLWALQSRRVPLEPAALFRFLKGELSHYVLSEDLAKRLISVAQLESLLVPPLNLKIIKQKKDDGDLLSSGTPISLGNASGVVVGSLDKTLESHQNKRVVLVIKKITLPMIIDLMDRKKYPHIVAVVAGNAGIGSHIARLATKVGERMSIIFGSDTRNIIEGEEVTVDGTTGEVFRGLIPRASKTSNHILTAKELLEARSWYREKISNPWQFVTDEDGIAEYIARGKTAFKEAKKDFRSTKAQTQAVINALIPEDIRVNYSILKPDQIEKIRLLAESILKKGNHVTIRSCYYPDQQYLPWVFIARPSQIDEFLSNPEYPGKYGGYPKWITNPNLTEVLVGSNPKDKLNPDPAISREHGSWTLTCSDQGEVILQIDPYTPHLRSHEDVDKENLVTCFVDIDPNDPNNISNIRVEMGENIQDEPIADNLTKYTISNILTLWWAKYDIPKRMAAATEIFPHKSYATPVLEGQTRFPSKWCLIYGIKIDPVKIG